MMRELRDRMNGADTRHRASSGKHEFWALIRRKGIRVVLLGNALYVWADMAPGIARDLAGLGILLVLYLSTTRVFRGDNEDLT